MLRAALRCSLFLLPVALLEMRGVYAVREGKTQQLEVVFKR